MDFGVAFQTASQAAHLEKIRFEEGIEMEIQNEHAGNSKHERNHWFLFITYLLKIYIFIMIAIHLEIKTIYNLITTIMLFCDEIQK